ncbi:J domain-containing protein [Spiroplasma endosymbiont of Labia minor]|uniref:J domain-containing protein n=1 Tax=Spiroplasma endosymbiont of Labia minor TaxID=3066305 RepID=UPI003BB0880A
MNFWWYIIIVIIISLFSGGGGIFGRKRNQNNKQREEKKRMSLNQLNDYFQNIKNTVVSNNQKEINVKGYDVNFKLLNYPFHISLQNMENYLNNHVEDLNSDMEIIKKQIVEISTKMETIFKKYESQFLQEIDRILNGMPIEGDWVYIIGNAYSEYYSKFLLIAIDYLAEDIYPFLFNKLYKKSANIKKIKYSSEEEYFSSRLDNIETIMKADFNSIFEDLVMNLNIFFFKKRQDQNYDNYDNSNVNVKDNSDFHSYEVLGLNSFATNAEIKKRYRELAKKYHPDTSVIPNSKEKMLEINVAYEKIKKNRNIK